MITKEDVFNVFVAVTSPSALLVADKVLPLCDIALENLKKELSPAADPADSRIAYAAGTEACYQYALSLCADPEKSADFKAGDVTVTRKLTENLKIAESIRQSGRQVILPLLDDKGFGAWSV